MIKRFTGAFMCAVLLLLSCSVSGGNARAVDLQGTDADLEAIVAAYNNACTATVNPPKGKLSLNFDGRITGDGFTGFLLWAISPIAKRTLAKAAITTDYIPGYDQLLTSDVVEAASSSANGVTTIQLKLKEQVDGFDASAKDGPVGRGIGTLGNFSRAAKKIGANITEGSDSISITYQNAVIKVTIDENTGTITGGTWQYSANLHIGKIKVSFRGFPLTFKNVKAKIDFSVVI